MAKEMKESQATIGLTDYAQSQLKDIVYVELPEIGSEFKKGESMGVVESVKTVADVFSPITGKWWRRTKLSRIRLNSSMKILMGKDGLLRWR